MFAVLGNLLLASVAVASLQLGGSHQSRTFQHRESPAGIASRDTPGLLSHFAGAVCTAKQQGDLTTVAATLEVPRLLDTGNNLTAGAFVVGLDGECSNGAALQIGLVFEYINETAQYSVLCRWTPENTFCGLSGMTMNAGDIVSFMVSITSETNGTATAQNNNTAETWIQSFAMDSSSALCLRKAGWYMQPTVDDNGTPIPMANFGKLNITNAIAFGPNVSCTPKDANITTLEENAYASTSGGRNLTIQYFNNSVVGE